MAFEEKKPSLPAEKLADRVPWPELPELPREAAALPGMAEYHRGLERWWSSVRLVMRRIDQNGGQ